MPLKLELSHQKILFGCLFRGLRTIYPVALTTAVDQHHWTTLRCRSHVPHVPPIVSPFCVGAFSGLVGKRIGVSTPLFSSRKSHSLHFPAIIGVIVADNPGENFVVSERECLATMNACKLANFAARWYSARNRVFAVRTNYVRHLPALAFYPGATCGNQLVSSGLLPRSPPASPSDPAANQFVLTIA